MAVYNLNGSQISIVYGVSGSELAQAYDIDQNPLLDVGDTLTVMTYNVQRCRGINSQQTMQNAIFNAYNADIIGLQELGSEVSLPSVLSALDNYAVKQFSNHNNKVLMVKKTGSLSNVVIADFTNQDPQDASQYNETRAYMKADITVDGKTVTWINTHLCYLTASVKYLQMAEIFALAEQCEYCIITGDFNSQEVTATSDDYIDMYKQFVDAGYNLANNSPQSGFTNTFTESATASTLSELTKAPDTIITTSNIDILGVTFDTTKFSYLNGSSIDHIPVIALLRIN